MVPPVPPAADLSTVETRLLPGVPVAAVSDGGDFETSFIERDEPHRCCCCDVCCYPDCDRDFDDYFIPMDLERLGRLEKSEQEMEAVEEAEQRKHRTLRESARRVARRERRRS